MIKLKDLLNEIKNGRIGDFFMQKAGSDIVNYGVIVDELANGAFKVVMFPVRNGKMTGKAKTASTKGWYPEPKKISKDEIPSKVLSKIETKSKKYESVSESINEGKYPYYGQLDNVNWSKVGANKGEMDLVIKFTAPDTGTVIRGNSSHPKGKKSKRWSEKNFKPIKFSESIDESVKEGSWTRHGGLGSNAPKGYEDVHMDDHFDKWRMKMKDILDKKNVARDAYDIWIDKIKNAKSTKETSKVTKGIKNIVESVNESQTYFQTFSAAVQHAAEQAEKKGYQIDEDEWFSQIGTGGSYTRSRPSKGDTHRFTVGLLKRGKPARKSLQIQVYGMENGKYELNSYIN